MSKNILILEDDQNIRELMSLHLQRDGFQVFEAKEVDEAKEHLKRTKLDLMLVDWMLPGLTGLDFLRWLKLQTEFSSIPILMVTARVEPQDVVLGLEEGADDYLTKPFEISVFKARVRALLRRADLAQNRTNDSEEIKIGSLLINAKTCEVLISDVKVELTPSEFKILMILASDRGRVFTRDHLVKMIQGEGVNVVGRTVDTHVFGLRKKLGSEAEWIETIRGIGYRVK